MNETNYCSHFACTTGAIRYVRLHRECPKGMGGGATIKTIIVSSRQRWTTTTPTRFSCSICRHRQIDTHTHTWRRSLHPTSVVYYSFTKSSLLMAYGRGNRGYYIHILLRLKNNILSSTKHTKLQTRVSLIGMWFFFFLFF